MAAGGCPRAVCDGGSGARRRNGVGRGAPAAGASGRRRGAPGEGRVAAGRNRRVGAARGDPWDAGRARGERDLCMDDLPRRRRPSRDRAAQLRSLPVVGDGRAGRRPGGEAGGRGGRGRPTAGHPRRGDNARRGRALGSGRGQEAQGGAAAHPGMGCARRGRAGRRGAGDARSGGRAGGGDRRGGSAGGGPGDCGRRARPVRAERSAELTGDRAGEDLRADRSSGYAARERGGLHRRRRHLGAGPGRR